MTPNNCYAPTPTPNEFEINEHACLLAKEDGRTGWEIFNLIRWPRHASRPLGAFAEANAAYVAEVRERARKILTDQMAALHRASHRARIKRWKRRKKTNKTRFWTTRPTKHGQTPPPRRRRFHPPVKQARQDRQGREARENNRSEQSRPHKTPMSTRYILAPPGVRAPPPLREPPDPRPQQTPPGSTPCTIAV